MNEITITLTKSQVENLIEFFELDFINLIRETGEIDNMAYLVDMCDVFGKLGVAKTAFEIIDGAKVDEVSVEVEDAPTTKMTNYDRIMAMSAEGLAGFIADINGSCDCCTQKECATCSDDTICDIHIRQWLEMEAGE